MIKWFFLPVVCLWMSYAFLYAQSPHERVYIQTDRDFYVQGETVHFKGYVTAISDTIESTNLFVELLDTAGNRMAGICLPLIGAAAAGSILMPATQEAEILFLRAYTDITQQQRIPYQFIKPLFATMAGQSLSGEAQTELLTPNFFPEGGQLVYNADNYVAFKSSAVFEGIIKNNKGEKITNIKPISGGMGIFKFRPVPGETYSCHWKNNEQDQFVALPKPVQQGIAIHAYQQNEMLYIDLDNGGATGQHIRKPVVELHIGGEVVYMASLNMSNFDKFGFAVPLQELKPAIAELKVLDADRNILATRPVFIAKKSLTPGFEVDILKKNLAARGQNHISINFHDTLLKYVSVSVTDVSYADTLHKPGIVSVFFPPGFYLPPHHTGDIGDADPLDLAVLCMGNIPLPEHNKMDAHAPKQPKYLELSGMVKKGKKTYANKEVIVGIRSEYSGKELYKVITDEEGRFVLEGIILYGDSYIHSRKPGDAEEELVGDYNLKLPSFTEDAGLLNNFLKTVRTLRVNKTLEKDIPVTAKSNPLLSDTVVYEDSIVVLEEAVVTTNTSMAARKRVEELEKKYIEGTSFAGYSATGETLDVMNDPQSVRLNDLIAYIGLKMRSVSQRFVKGRRELAYYGRGTGGETIISVFYMNNTKIDRDLVETIRLNEVAVVKFIPMFASEQGFPPAIAIFLKKPGDQGYWEKDRYQLSEKKVTGYSVSKEYSMPDYHKGEIKVQKDGRKTLFWQPYVGVEKGIAEIKFFNNDFTRKIILRAEGVTIDGKIVYFEKVLD